MNDDLKAYVDGELPPDAAEKVRAALEHDRELAAQMEQFRQISDSLRSYPEPESVGQAATLAALSARRGSFGRTWGLALAGCATVLFFAAWTLRGRTRPNIIPVRIPPAERTETASRRSRDSGRKTEGLRTVHPRTRRPGPQRWRRASGFLRRQPPAGTDPSIQPTGRNAVARRGFAGSPGSLVTILPNLKLAERPKSR